MYQLLFRSRWFAFAWMIMMAAGAVIFTTTGAGAFLTAGAPTRSASDEAESRQSKFKAWAADDPAGEAGSEPSRPDKLRDGTTRNEDSGSQFNSVPYSGNQSDSDDPDSDDGESPDNNSQDSGPSH